MLGALISRQLLRPDKMGHQACVRHRSIYGLNEKDVDGECSSAALRRIVGAAGRSCSHFRQYT
jgi:hypothetical protein